ncbi:hypothetical protein NGRA_2315 [Nosema granulosis]|uniref:Uncharacterized protein n=1 Tax=Nosema granulosis TaxID=83296 RepID=A0A9P6GYD4_9MICR|nr:hypothetical protein NGRA_2315 [Nosema granulosis]
MIFIDQNIIYFMMFPIIYSSFNKTSESSDLNTPISKEDCKSFITKELTHINVLIHCKIEKQVIVDPDKLLERVAILQKRHKYFYKNRNNKGIKSWLYVLFKKIHSKSLIDKIKIKLASSNNLLVEIEKRYPDSGLFHKRNENYYRYALTFKLNEIAENDRSLIYLKSVFLENIAQNLFEHFKYSVIDGTEHFWKPADQHIFIKNKIASNCNKLLNDYTNLQSFFDGFIQKMIDYITLYHQKIAI